MAWRDIAFHRHLIIHDGLIFDVARISNPHRQALYWTLHVDGTPGRRIRGMLPASEAAGALEECGLFTANGKR